MKLYLDCIQCIQRQALQAARFGGADEETQKKIVRRTLEILLKSDWSSSPMGMGSTVLAMVKKVMGLTDPYLAVKKQSNREAQEHVPHVLERIENADDPINIALKAAIGGNIIDYGAKASFDLDATMDRVFDMNFAIDDEVTLINALEKADSIAYLADNAGEIVFDKVLIETIMREQGKKNVLFVVRDDPMLNDALLEDTEEIGLSALDNVEVATMPPRIPGPAEDAYSVWERIENSDVVISKGQGNYEAFSSQAGIFFLLMAKCELIAGDINQRVNANLKVGDMILWKGDGKMSYES